MVLDRLGLNAEDGSQFLGGRRTVLRQYANYTVNRGKMLLDACESFVSIRNRGQRHRILAKLQSNSERFGEWPKVVLRLTQNDAAPVGRDDL
jgi:hypothetical protein